MPFDPHLPVINSPVSSAAMRDQFTGLKSLLDGKLSAETDPAFAASEAALFAPGDKAKLDALGGGGAGSYTSAGVAFNDVRQPDVAQDTWVSADVDLESAGVGHCQVGAVIGPTNPPAQLSLATRGFTGTGMVSVSMIFVVPKGWYYKLLNVTTGAGSVAVLNDTWEFPLNR
jgi:hypothetical protein